jgi:antitoxin component YwqK of YwqJK toxin-antitoxin module
MQISTPYQWNNKEMAKKTLPQKETEIIDGYTIKYHANGITRWSKGKIIDGHPEGYWEWYRLNGTIKRSGYFHKGEPVGDWTTYNDKGEVYKVTRKKQPYPSIDQAEQTDPE